MSSGRTSPAGWHEARIAGRQSTNEAVVHTSLVRMVSIPSLLAKPHRAYRTNVVEKDTIRHRWMGHQFKHHGQQHQTVEDWLEQAMA